MSLLGTAGKVWICPGTANLSSSTWIQAEPVSYNDNINPGSDLTNLVFLTTSFQNSATFILSGSVTISAIGFKIGALPASPGTSTITIALDQSGTTVTGTSVTFQISYLVGTGWVLIALSGNVTLTAGTYSLKILASVGFTVQIQTTSGTSSFCKMLLTTTTGTPVASGSESDNLYIIGTLTYGGTSITGVSCTWDSTDATDAWNMLTLGSNCNLSCAALASTNYYMILANDFRCYYNCLFKTASIWPTSSTFTMQFNSTAAPGSAGGYGLVLFNNATVDLWGDSSKTCNTTLTADAATAATSVTVSSAFGWAVSDKLAFASTDLTATHCESKAISSVSGTTIGVAALTNAHSGTSPTIAEVINLTRLIKVQGKDSTHLGYVVCQPGANFSCYGVEFTNLGGSTSGYLGININSTSISNAIYFYYCSFHDFATGASGIVIQAGTNTVTINTCSFYNIPNNHLLVNGAANALTVNVDGCVFMLNTNASDAIVDWSGPVGHLETSTIVGSVATGSQGGLTLRSTGYNTYSTFSYITVHSCAGSGITLLAATGLSNNVNLTMSNLTTWRNTANGIYYNALMTSATVTINTWTSFGNGNAQLSFNNNFTGTWQMTGLTWYTGTTYTCPIGLQTNPGTAISYNSIMDMYIDSSDLGSTGSHTNGDIDIYTVGQHRIYCRNCKFGSTPVNNQTNLVNGGFVASDRHSQTANNYAYYAQYGTLTEDTTIYKTASPSARMTGNSTINSQNLGEFKISINNGDTPTISFQVRKSVSGDGAAYNGSAPVLILKANPGLGIASDTTLATLSGGSGSWTTLAGTFPSAATSNGIAIFMIQISGSTGWVNVDDMATTETGNDEAGMSFAYHGQIAAQLGSGSGGGGSTVILPMHRTRPA